MPDRSLRRAPLVLLAAACVATPLAAQAPPSLDAFGLLVAVQSRPSFAVLGAGARAAGMGGAFTAVADDASAASFNPAGLALLLRPEASLVVDGRRHSEEHAAFVNAEPDETELYAASQTDFERLGLNFASATLPTTVADRNLCFQVSYHRAIDFAYGSERILGEAGVDGGSRVRQRIDQDGGVDTYTLAAAYQLTERLSLGLTATRWQGSWTFANRTEEVEDGTTQRLAFTQSNDWRGWEGTLGLLLRYRYVNVGATLRSGFGGRYDVTSRLATNFTRPFAERSRFEGTLHWPESWTLGVAVKPTETWYVTADYAVHDWDDMTISGLPGGEVNFFDLQPTATSTARAVGVWRVGTELTFFPGREVVAVRAGGFVEPRPTRLGPDDDAGNVTGLSLGAGWRHGPVTVDLAWQHTSSEASVLQFVDPSTIAGGQVASSSSGRVRTAEDRVFLSFLWRFAGVEARDVLHFLFVGPLDRKGKS